MGPPSSGGLMLSLMFNMLEHKELNSNEPHDVNNIVLPSEIMQIAYALLRHLADPDFHNIPYDYLQIRKLPSLLH